MKFTPRDRETGHRLTLTIKNQYIPRGKAWRKVITDTKTGRRFLVSGASCELPNCYCDAVATELPKKHCTCYEAGIAGCACG